MNSRTENPDTFSHNPVASLKQDALDMVEKCIECGSCYVDCAFGNYGDDPEKCREMIRESNDFLTGKIKKISPELMDANLKCAECNRCHINCPEDIYRRHGNMMMKHMTGNPLKLRMNIHPYSNRHVKQPAIEKFVVSKWEDAEKKWYANDLNTLKPAEVLLYHGCYVYLQAAQCIKLEKMLDAAGVNYTAVGKLEYCCGAFGFYRGHNDMAGIKPRLVEMLEKVRPKRIITNCGHCYNSMVDLVNSTGNSDTIRVIHAVEELSALTVDKRLDFAHMGQTYAIHDACNFRTLHDEHSVLRGFLRRIGSIHEMLSHGKNGKCCGDVSRYYAPDHIDQDNREVKIREFVSSGADRMITVCAGCYEHFMEYPRLHTIDFIDVAFDAFCKARAEESNETKANNTKWVNMAPVIEGDTV